MSLSSGVGHTSESGGPGPCWPHPWGGLLLPKRPGKARPGPAGVHTRVPVQRGMSRRPSATAAKPKVIFFKALLLLVRVGRQRREQKRRYCETQTDVCQQNHQEAEKAGRSKEGKQGRARGWGCGSGWGRISKQGGLEGAGAGREDVLPSVVSTIKPSHASPHGALL